MERLISESKDAHVIIAVDGGLDFCIKAGIEVHHFIGDGDSLKQDIESYKEAFEAIRPPRAALPKTVQLDKDKDFSDFEAALRFIVVEYQATAALVLGMYGGRLDQQLCVIGDAEKHLETCHFVSEHECATLLTSHDNKEKFLEFNTPMHFSTISLGGKTIISIEKAKWQLQHHVLEPLSSYGLSNEGIARITLHMGSLLVVSRDTIVLP